MKNPITLVTEKDYASSCWNLTHLAISKALRESHPKLPAILLALREGLGYGRYSPKPYSQARKQNINADDEQKLKSYYETKNQHWAMNINEAGEHARDKSQCFKRVKK